jgi:hypothetical protein
MTEIKYKIITWKEWIRGDYRPLAIIKYSAEELAYTRNLIFTDGYDDGLGKTKDVLLITSDNRQYTLTQHLQSPAPYNNYIDIYLLNDELTLERDLNTILEILELGSVDLIWVDPRIKLIPYETWRQDDNGNKFLMEIVKCRADANLKLKNIDTNTHKQFYLIEPHKEKE